MRRMSSFKNIFSYFKKDVSASSSILGNNVSLQPVSFFKLFAFSTKWERFALFIGFILTVISGSNLPIINLLYGELTNVMIDRQFPTDLPSEETFILKLFGGGKVLVNASKEMRMITLDADAVAFVISVTVSSVVALVLLALAMFIFNILAVIQVRRIKVKLFQSLLSQSSEWFDLRQHGNIPEKITEEVNNVQKAIGERLIIFVYQMTTTILSLGISFYIGWLLTLVLLAFMIPMIPVLLVLNQIQSRLKIYEVASAENASEAVEETFTLIRTVVAYGGEEKEIGRYAEKLLKTQSLNIKKELIAAFGIGFTWIIVYSSYAVGFSFGIRLIMWNDEYNATTLIAVFFGVLTAATILIYSGPYWELFANARISAALVFHILGTKSEINPFSRDGFSGGDSIGEIEFKNVHFHYPSRPEENVLKGLSFKINSGEKVAIIGGSGSGKSTILQLIQRLYDPVVGDIFLDGVNLKSLNVSWLRRQLGVVFQEPILFTGTVSENIAYGFPQATDLEIEEAAKIAQAHGFILNLPDKYDTMLEGSTGNLSGGQKQRITIARAIIRKPKILLLDEITSALDKENRRLVEKAINEADTDLTRITVTHNLRNLAHMDRIIVLENGIIVEDGRHEDLVKLNGAYNRLLEMEISTKERLVNREAKDRVWDTSSRTVDEPIRSFLGMRGLCLSDFSSLIREQESGKIIDDRFIRMDCCQFLRWNNPHWPFLYFGMISAIILGCTLPILVLTFGELVGLLSDVQESTIYNVDILSIFLALVGVASSFFSFIQTYFLGIASARLGTYLRVKAFQTIMYQEVGWFDSKKNRVSNLCTLLNSDCSAVQSVFGNRTGSVIQGVISVVLGIFISMYYSYKLTLLTILVLPLIFAGVISDMFSSKKQNKFDEEDQENESKITTEALNNIKLVNSLGCETLLLSRYSELLTKRKSNHKCGFFLRGFAYSIGQTIIFFAYAISLWFGIYLMMTEDLHYKEVIKVSEMLIYGCWVLSQTLPIAPNFRNAKNGGARLQYLYLRRPKMISGTSPWPHLDESKKITFSSVFFSYPERPFTMVLKNLNLLIKDGESIALIGESGSGKSTVLQLLLRFYDPINGSISIGRMKLQNFKLSNIRRSMGLISQQPVLFNRTIYENIAYGDNSREVTLDDVIAAAEAADIHNFISSLPAGYETNIGRFSSFLSVGEKQKIAIARALIRNPRILLLDEATSALDPESERNIQETLEKVMSDRTTITVAHTSKAIVNADTIYVLTDGRITESGSHSELMKLKGFYYKMCSEVDD